MLLLILCTLTFIVLSGLVAMVDAAVLSVSAAETEELVARKAWGAPQLRTVTGRLTRAVVVIVIVTNTINILGPILVGQMAVGRYGTSAIGWMTIVLTLGTIVFSEIIPKSLGAHYAPRIARYSALPILALMAALYPLVVLLDAFSGLFRRGGRRIGTEAQIRALTTLGRRAGYIEADEGLLVQRAFILNDRTAGDIMTPRERIVSLDLGMTLDDAAKLIHSHEFSRYPICGESLDDFRGTILARDILRELALGKNAEPIDSLLRPAAAIAADSRCDNLLVSFRLRRNHLAVVEREGTTVGLVTLEDVLEELVGEIHDEKDVPY